jgi:mannonate dehydratase
MNRRQFISSSGVAALAAGKGSAALAAPAGPAVKPVMMKLGCQSAPTNDIHLK